MSHSTHLYKSCDFSLSAKYILNSIASHYLHSYSHSPSHQVSCLSYCNSLKISVLVSSHDLPSHEVHPTHSKMNVLKHKSDIPLYHLKFFKHISFTTKGVSILSFWPFFQRLSMVWPLPNMLTSSSAAPPHLLCSSHTSFLLHCPTCQYFHLRAFQLAVLSTWYALFFIFSYGWLLLIIHVSRQAFPPP